MKRTKQGTLHIGQPRIERVDGKVRLVASVTHEPIPGVEGTGGDMWFAVAEEYGKYLCFERSDAFVIGMLYYCMWLGLDVVSEAPISEEILFNLRTYYIPSIAKNCEEMYGCAIMAQPALERLPNAGVVATGISCGIDSLHALYEQSNSDCQGLNVTHLVLNNAGHYKGGSQQFSWQIQHAKDFAAKYGYKFVETDSNYIEIFPLNHKRIHWANTYANAFCALCLQKLWGKFTIASAGWGFEYFNLANILTDDPATYDLLFLNVISSSWLRFYSGGGAKTRFEKTKELVNYEPAKWFLHVCTDDTGPNCNVCAKCIRTLVTLDAIGHLDDFSHVFDIDYYRENRSFYLKALYWSYLTEGKISFLNETMMVLRKEISLKIKIPVWYAIMRRKLSKLRRLSAIYHVLNPCKLKEHARRENFGSLPVRKK